ncbi:uncharacterized protein SPPG_04113 [Spizellomyces punctatus DAOM BR117]|uniref:Uncharacterized protein n=1 Tax=Spizellomyces punctatus (strain DAOM BR117) TaxID=645134 RepID=A0A0L0HJK6_SPIPD|nr:uncharacterized protein SPPG_04113 [Spizellomyces punctatus DAOM BR117]KND01019.1 hypothetical protein SPPG_04113 [Spizellomyces punctatus DAOM BR117]|eukprot:XP_016609058.1 hypothetical protein SPPG_04113 [Spizellomyces punctatus DAOM BR117]
MAAESVSHGVQPTERSPLLGTTQVGSQDTEHICERSPRFTLPNRRTILLSLLVVGILILGVVVPVVYFVVIPDRLREALNGNGADIRQIHVIDIQNDRIALRVRGLAHNDDVPPVRVTMHPTLFSFLNIAGATQESVKTLKSDMEISEEELRIGSLQFPGLVVPRGAVSVPIDFVSAVEHLNIPLIERLLSSLLKGGEEPMPPQMFRLQASPLMSLQHVGSWVIPLQNNIFFDPSKTSAPDLSQFNITLVDSSYTPNATDPSQLLLFANLSFDNPTVLSFAPQNISVLFSIHYENDRIVDVMIPSSTTQLAQGHNSNATVYGSTVPPEGTMKLMQLVGKYAEGENTTVVLKNFRLEYEQRRASLPWIEDILADMEFEVEIPAPEESDDDGLRRAQTFGINTVKTTGRTRKALSAASRFQNQRKGSS